MRKIQFRGKDKDGQWRYGRLAYMLVDGIVVDAIQDEKLHVWQVEPETVGESTGLYDRGGQLICEGDILQGGYDDEDGEYEGDYYCVYFEKGEFSAMAKTGSFSLRDVATLSVIRGNRWDDEDLLTADDSSEYMG